MLHSASSRVCSAALAVVVVALSACDNHVNSNTASPDLRSQHDLTAGARIYPGDSLNSKTLVIGGPSVGYLVPVGSPSHNYDGLSIHASIVQQLVRQAAGDQSLSVCFPAALCDVQGSVAAAATSGLLPGAATVELQLIQTSTGSVLGTLDFAVTLVAPPTVSITGSTLSANTAAIGGSAVPYQMTINNPGPTRQFVQVVSNIIQGAAVRRANAAFVNCGGIGTLSTGTCSFASNFVASSTNSGTGTLEPGPASLEENVVDASTGKVLAKKTVPISLKSSATITGLSLSSTGFNTVTVLIEGASAAYTATLQNVGSSLSGISIQGFISQGDGAARRFAGGTSVSCGSGAAVLPTGTCTLSSQLTVTNNSGGKGTLVSGDATFELQLVDASGAVLSTATFPLNLADGPIDSPPNADRFVGTKTLQTAKP